MLKEEHGALAGGLGGVDLAPVEDPAKAAVAEVVDHRGQHAADCAADGSAGIAADVLADPRDDTTQLIEDALDGAGDRKVGGDGQESRFDDRFPLGDHILGQLALHNALGHHGDLTRLQHIRDKAQHDYHQDQADHRADDQAQDPGLEELLAEEKAKRTESQQQDDGQDMKRRKNGMTTYLD